MDFELIHIFPFKFEFSGSWSLREIVSTSINSQVPKIEQYVIKYGLKTFLFDLVDMHWLSPNIKEVMEFQREISVKQNLNLGKLWSISSI
jgi:hypothetical protein